MVKNMLKRKNYICSADYDLCHLNVEEHLTFHCHNITFCCFLFVGYERCTYGTIYHYCDTGSCCKISGNWYCTGIIYSRSDCDSFAR